MPKRNSLWKGSRRAGVNSASPCTPLSRPERSSRESPPESRQSASPARPASGRSSSPTKTHRASAADWSTASSVRGKNDSSIVGTYSTLGSASGRSDACAMRSRMPLTNALDSSEPYFLPSSTASLSVTFTGTSGLRRSS